MTKEEINKKIFELKTDEEIEKFVQYRIQELENESVEKTVGQGYTDSFKDYISSKIHYKPASKFSDGECPDLVYDDITPYINLIKSIKESSWYNEMTLFSTIFFEIHDYLPSNDIGFGRYMTYSSHVNDKLSIKEVKKEEIAFCSEKSGLSHNMFKFLGIDSELVCGKRNEEMHAYNLIYPKGYNNSPAVLYDPSFFVSFTDDNNKYSFGYYKVLTDEEKEDLLKDKTVKMELSKTENNYRKYYNLDEDLKFEADLPEYTYGINNAKKMK